jgi:hypothetical protein
VRRYLIRGHLLVLDHHALHLSPHAGPLGVDEAWVLGLLDSHHALVARLLAGHHGLEPCGHNTITSEGLNTRKIGGVGVQRVWTDPQLDNL